VRAGSPIFYDQDDHKNFMASLFRVADGWDPSTHGESFHDRRLEGQADALWPVLPQEKHLKDASGRRCVAADEAPPEEMELRPPLDNALGVFSLTSFFLRLAASSLSCAFSALRLPCNPSLNARPLSFPEGVSGLKPYDLRPELCSREESVFSDSEFESESDSSSESLVALTV
jgi:hypothetical protein